ncbi:methionine--tRNA ligase [candidate division WWE3 bacterium CG_4_9_14_3_um_filter_41_6]|uniref:Methionine--tRNA ligase n=1 Tax=candidate division WWE3 bacterium CG_4_10_14_0_2_um_filter_41_14 TaxID=1975072 RepID=A0A2M7TIC5_UNCKA|nr:MAG: methionine--tRNA ligase [candidate division WWE3 bacterium CG_4_10_14_0_2_um_filter_41_14]PJA38716.1 MAG: methionine--tRNA ligase [candidate division WWE3 bacterium CG_4_9_14_3_um_filter_41_6]
MQTITLEQFQTADIKIGTVLSAEPVDGSTKLLKLSVDLGEESPRQIIAGLAPSIADPTDLVGKQVPIIANLQPRMIMGLESQGMVLAIGTEGPAVLLHPASQVESGSKLQ